MPSEIVTNENNTEDITEDQLSRTGILLHGEQDFLTTIPNIDNGLVEYLYDLHIEINKYIVDKTDDKSKRISWCEVIPMLLSDYQQLLEEGNLDHYQGRDEGEDSDTLKSLISNNHFFSLFDKREVMTPNH